MFVLSLTLFQVNTYQYYYEMILSFLELRSNFCCFSCIFGRTVIWKYYLSKRELIKTELCVCAHMFTHAHDCVLLEKIKCFGKFW